MGALTDTWSYSNKQGKRIKHKDCEIVNNFRFSQNDFYVLLHKNIYYVCYSHNGELYVVWHKVNKDTSAGEVVSEFRKGFIKNKITQQDISNFIENPAAYAKGRKA